LINLNPKNNTNLKNEYEIKVTYYYLKLISQNIEIKENKKKEKLKKKNEKENEKNEKKNFN
jgi:hypothetical protein